MSYYVSTLHNLPTGNLRFYIHVTDTTDGTHSKWITDNLHAIGQLFGPNAGLVTGPENLTTELHHMLKAHTADKFDLIDTILHRSTCLVISEGHLASTAKKVYLLPLAPPDSSTDTHEFMDTLLRMLANALQAGKHEELFSNLGATPVALTPASGGFIVCSLRNINQVLDLKPNLIGIGLNLNALIDKLLPPVERKI